MPFTRRRFLGLFITLLPLTACNQRDPLLTKKIKGLSMEPISAEELELIKNPLSRPAYFARMGLPQGVLEIRQRVFGDARGLLRGTDIKDVRFLNCVFDLFQGYDNNLENVVFEECQFFGAIFNGSEWKNAKLLRCEAEGPFQIGCADGDVLFEECKMKGMTAKEGGYGNWADHFGLATGQDGRTTFAKCKLENIRTGGAKLLAFSECDISDLYANSRSQKGQLLVDRCKAKGKQMFGGSGNDFSRITIKDSQLGEVDLMSASSQVVEISNSSLSLEMGAFETRLGDIKLKNTAFHGRGFSCVLATCNSLLIEECKFEGSEGLQLFGKPNPNAPSPGRGPIYWSRIRELTMRNTVVPNANLAYMQVGSLTIDGATLKNTDLSHGRVDAIQFRNARLEGNLNLAETTIRRIDNQGLTNQAKMTGKLEADANAPMPELERPKLDAGKNPKNAKPE